MATIPPSPGLWPTSSRRGEVEEMAFPCSLGPFEPLGIRRFGPEGKGSGHLMVHSPHLP
jgi:hypothetical protein